VILVRCENIRVEGLNLSSTTIGIELWETSNSSISGNNITNNYYGLLLVYSSNYNSISGNNITANNYYGLLLDYSSNCSISGNNIANSYFGIFLHYSSNNKFYHNNFIDNTYQVYIYTPGDANFWDDSYPSGGNYWSDYTGVDFYSGPSQSIPGSDGVGDTPYVIDADNQDHYPLMKPNPWASHDVGITNVTTSKTVVGQGYNVSISIMAFNYGNYTENINITVYANTTMIGEINNIELSSRSFTIVQYTWSTSGFAKGKYSIRAVADTVQGETDILDNSYTGDWIFITRVGRKYQWL
jgi:parallel beta-helix repeat protein